MRTHRKTRSIPAKASKPTSGGLNAKYKQLYKQPRASKSSNSVAVQEEEEVVKGEFDAEESAESKAAARAASKISKV